MSVEPCAEEMMCNNADMCLTLHLVSFAYSELWRAMTCRRCIFHSLLLLLEENVKERNTFK